MRCSRTVTPLTSVALALALAFAAPRRAAADEPPNAASTSTSAILTVPGPRLIGRDICSQIVTPPGRDTAAFWSWTLFDDDQMFVLSFTSRRRFALAPFVGRHRVRFPVTARAGAYRCRPASPTRAQLFFPGGVVVQLFAVTHGAPPWEFVLEYGGAHFRIERAFG